MLRACLGISRLEPYLISGSPHRASAIRAWRTTYFRHFVLPCTYLLLRSNIHVSATVTSSQTRSLTLIMLRCKNFEFERFYLCVDYQRKTAICMIKHAFFFAKSRLLIFQIALHTILNEIEILVNIFSLFNILRFVLIESSIDDSDDLDANCRLTDCRENFCDCCSRRHFSKILTLRLSCTFMKNFDISTFIHVLVRANAN